MSVKQDWKWVPIAAVIWGVLGVGVAMLVVKHTFKSQTVLIWEPLGQGSAIDKDLATQAGSLKLPATAREIKRRLKIRAAEGAVSSMMDVWFDTSSNLVTIETRGATAKDAARLGETVVAVFFDQQRRVTRTRAEEAVANLESDARATRGRLDQARQIFDSFRKEHGFSDIAADLQVATQAVNQLKQQQELTRTDATTLAARAEQLAGMVKLQPRMTVQSASSSNPDALMLAQVRTALATARTRLVPSHPQIAALEAQAAALAIRVKQGLGVVSSGTTNSSANPEFAALQSSLSTTRLDKEDAANREKAYAGLIQSAEQRLAALTAIQGKAEGLGVDLKIIETHLQEISVSLAQARDAARLPQIEWRVFDKPGTPEWPEKSKRRVIAGAMPVAGALVAMLILCIRPLLGGRVYTAREAGFWTAFPVLASSTWPRDRESFFALLGDLGDQGAAAHGYTLVLGATEREKALAEELAYWLGGRGVADSGHQVGLESVRVNAPAVVTQAPGSAEPGSTSVSAGSGPVRRSEALVVMQPGATGPAPLALIPEGTHAWLGTTEGPSLRRAARGADRVIVLLTSGAEAFTSLSALRTRLGRDRGVGIVVLGLGAEFVNLPDRVGDVDAFWRHGAAGRNGLG